MVRERKPLIVASAVAMALLFSSLNPTPSMAVEYTDTFDVLDLTRPDLAVVASEVADGHPAEAAEALQEHFATRSAPVFTSISSGSGSALVSSTADELAAGYFEFRNGMSRDFSAGIDWEETWSSDPAIPLGQPHYWMYDFAFYATLTGAYLALPQTDSKRAVYTDAWQRTATDFMDSHEGVVAPYNRLGTAKRLTQWLAAYSVFKDSPTADPQVLARYVAQIHAMTEDLCRNLERHNGNNWYASIARAVYISAVYFPEFSLASAWERRVIGAMDRVVTLQMKGDAVQYEPALNYQAYNLDLLVQIELFGRLNGRSPLANHLQVMERQAEVIMSATMPDFTVPLIGDTPSASLSVAAYGELFDRDDMRWVGSGGTIGAAPAPTSDLAPYSYAFMRNGWGSEDAYMAIANQDTNYGASHRHPDDLSVVAYADGRPLLVDPGVVDYSDTPSGNWLRRTTAAHNTVEVNGLPQPGPSVGDRVRRTDGWASNAAFDFYAGSHDDYAPITHDRSVFFAKTAGLWVLSDRLQGSPTTNDYRQLWHPPADAPIDVTAAGTVNAGFGTVPGISVISVDAVSATVHDDGYIADGLGGVQSDVEYFSFDKSVAGPAVFDTVLVPGSSGAAPSVDVTRTPLGVPLDTATAFSIELDDSTLSFYQSFEAHPSSRTIGDLTSDGRVLAVTADALGEVSAIDLFGGTGVSDSAGNLVSSVRPLGDLSVTFGSTLRIETGGFRDSELRIRDADAIAVEVNGVSIPLVRDADDIVVAAQTSDVGNTLFAPTFDEAAGAVNVNIDGLGGEFQPGEGTWQPIETAPGSWGVAQTTSTAVEAALLRRTDGPDTAIAFTVDLESPAPTFGAGAYVRYVDPLNYFLGRIYRTGGVLSAQILKVVGGVATVIGEAPLSPDLSSPIGFELVAVGSSIELRVGGILAARAVDSAHSNGGVGIYAHRTRATFAGVSLAGGSRETSDFVSGTSGWTSTSGTWAAAQRSGEWGLHQQSSTARDAGITAGASSADQAITAQFVLASASASMAFGVQLRAADAANRIVARVYRTGGVVSAQILSLTHGAATVIASEPLTVDLSEPVLLEASAIGDEVVLAVNGAEAVIATSSTPAGGLTGLYTDRAAGAFETVTQSSLLARSSVQFDPASESGWQSIAGNWLATDAANGISQWDGSTADRLAVFTEIEANAQLTSTIQLRSGQSTMGVGHVLRYQDPGTYYLSRVYRTGGAYSAQVIRMLGGKATVLATTPLSSVAFPLELTSRASGDVIEMLVDGTTVVRVRDGELPSGVVGLYTHRSSVTFADIGLATLVDARDWRVDNGLVEVEGTELYTTAPDGQTSSATSASSLWRDVAVDAEVRHSGLATGEYLGIRLRSSGAHSGYALLIEETTSGTVAKIERKAAGSRGTQESIVLAEVPITIDFSAPLVLRGAAVRDTLTFSIDGVVVATAKDGIFTSGGAGPVSNSASPAAWSHFEVSAFDVGD